MEKLLDAALRNICVIRDTDVATNTMLEVAGLGIGALVGMKVIETAVESAKTGGAVRLQWRARSQLDDASSHVRRKGSHPGRTG